MSRLQRRVTSSSRCLNPKVRACVGFLKKEFKVCLGRKGMRKAGQEEGARNEGGAGWKGQDERRKWWIGEGGVLSSIEEGKENTKQGKQRHHSRAVEAIRDINWLCVSDFYVGSYMWSRAKQLTADTRWTTSPQLRRNLNVKTEAEELSDRGKQFIVAWNHFSIISDFFVIIQCYMPMLRYAHMLSPTQKPRWKKNY